MTGQTMKHIQASEAKAKFSELLDQVEQGETITITRHGKVIAHILPDDTYRKERVKKAIEGIMLARKTAPRVTTEEILAWRDEGRR
jgi:prevent-host-death family protein